MPCLYQEERGGGEEEEARATEQELEIGNEKEGETGTKH
jgi:hypothetical protein